MAFVRCDGLTDIEIPNSVIYLGSSAFQYCINLKSVTLSNNLKELSNNVFYMCENLTNIIIPSTVTKIGSSTFKMGSSTNKATIRFLGTTPPTIWVGTFDTATLDKIEVPSSAVDTYKAAANWSNFADYIVGY